MSGSITKTIRIRAVDLPKIESVMSEKGLTWSGAVHYLLSNKTEYSDRELERYRQKFSALSTRVRPEADKYFKNEQYTMLEIVPVGFKGAITSESVNTELELTIKNIKSMLPFMNITYDGFMKLIENGLTDLSLTVENGKLKTTNVDLKLDEFYEVCREIGVDPQQALNRTVQGMRKGK